MADARIYYMLLGTYRKYLEYRDVTVPYITVKIEGSSSFQMVVAYNLKKVSAPQCSGCYDESTSSLAAVEYYSDSTYKVGYYTNRTSYGSQQSDPEVDLVVSWDNRFQEIRAYFDEVDPPRGQGIVTLDIPANGANLTFTSAELGAVISKFIDSDAVIDMESEPQEQMFEFLWQFISWDNTQGIMLGSAERGITYQGVASSAIAGDLIEQVVSTYSVTAKRAIKARVGTVNSLDAYANFARNAVLSNSFSGYNRLIISKLTDESLPFEVGFVWAAEQGIGNRGGQKGILKRNGDFVPHGTSDLTQGEFITFNATSYYIYIQISTFSGTIKYQSNNGSLVEVSGSAGLSMNLPNGLSVFFCYPA